FLELSHPHRRRHRRQTAEPDRLEHHRALDGIALGRHRRAVHLKRPQDPLTTARSQMKVPLLDLKAHHAPIREELLSAMKAVLDSGVFILGPDVAKLEEEAAAFCGARFAVGLSSGTDALLSALMALRIGPGDEVITSPFSF